MRIVLLALLLFAAPWIHAQDELLEPEAAFRYSARLIDPANLEARFQIADEYYLYRDKIEFSVDGEATLGQPALPAGKVKQDEYFGKVETYRGDLRIRIPVKGAAKPFMLKAKFQGCADLGVCYPPQEGLANILPVAKAEAAPPPAPAAATIPASAPQTSGSASGAVPGPAAMQDPGLIDRLRKLAGNFTGGNAEPEFLPPDEAFQVALESGPDGKLVARFNIVKGYYLYRDKTELRVMGPAGIKLGTPAFPPADEKTDPNFGKTYVYHQPFDVAYRFVDLPAGETKLVIGATYQGCSEKGICYPPIDKEFTLKVAAAAQVEETPAPPVGQAEAPAQPPVVDESDAGKVTALLKGGNFWLIVMSFFGFGLLLALTPCVFPMIPILSGIIVGQGQHLTKRRGFLLSLSYVLGMAVTYALVGIAAGKSGTLISSALQNPIALGIGAAIFLLLALSMFGFYELQLPSFLQSRFTEASNKLRGGNIAGVFVMGAISALIVGPCVAAPLAGALLYIGQSGDVVLGGASLFTMALGMGVPLLIVGVSAGALLPRAGAWMDAVKKFFGMLMVAVAIWMLSPLITPIAQMLLWAALTIISAVYLKAMEPLAVNASGWTRFWKGVGIMSLVAGIGLLLGAMGGSRDLLQPLLVYKGGGEGGAGEVKHLNFMRVKDMDALDAAIKTANGRYVMLDFYADWCVSCKELDRFTFSDPGVQERLKDVVLLQVDVTDNRAEDKALLQRFTLFGPPGLIFFDRDGKEIPYRVIGYEAPDKFLQSLGKAIP